MKDIKYILREFRSEKKEIDYLIDRYMKLTESLQKTNKMLQKVCVKTLKISYDNFSDKIFMRDSMAYVIKIRIEKHAKKQKKLFDLVSNLEDSKQRLVIEKYYLLSDDIYKTWEEIAKDLGYSERHLRRIHGEALEELRKKIAK